MKTNTSKNMTVVEDNTSKSKEHILCQSTGAKKLLNLEIIELSNRKLNKINT